MGCSVSQLNVPAFGSLVRVTPNTHEEYHVFGLIHDIHIDDDGLVRQLVTTDQVDAAVIADNRVNRNVPVEISVLAVATARVSASTTCCRPAAVKPGCDLPVRG